VLLPARFSPAFISPVDLCWPTAKFTLGESAGEAESGDQHYDLEILAARRLHF
jgi:hypothetical protein